MRYVTRVAAFLLWSQLILTFSLFVAFGLSCQNANFAKILKNNVLLMVEFAFLHWSKVILMVEFVFSLVQGNIDGRAA